MIVNIQKGTLCTHSEYLHSVNITINKERVIGISNPKENTDKTHSAINVVKVISDFIIIKVYKIKKIKFIITIIQRKTIDINIFLLR